MIAVTQARRVDGSRQIDIFEGETRGASSTLIITSPFAVLQINHYTTLSLRARPHSTPRLALPLHNRLRLLAAFERLLQALRLVVEHIPRLARRDDRVREQPIAVAARIVWQPAMQHAKVKDEQPTRRARGRLHLGERDRIVLEPPAASCSTKGVVIPL